MKIGIFGGTFNPIHKGHLSIIKDIKAKVGLDIVYVVPTYKTPDKDFEIERIQPKKRLEMVRETIKAERLDWLRISEYEYNNKGVSYTYKTISYFKNKYPEDSLYLIMGEDRYLTFDTWNKVDDIKENAKIIVYRRNKKINSKLASNNKIKYIGHKFYDISSTDILTNLKWDLIPEAARNYIAKNRMYLKAAAFKKLHIKKYEHAVATASHCKRLAEYNKYRKKDKAYLAGLLHDLFKVDTIERQRELFDKWNNEELEVPIPDAALHGYVCAYWLENEYGIHDEEFTNAIKRHTLFYKKPTKLDKILYAADKIASDRKGDRVGKLRLLTYKDLDQTIIKMLRSNKKYLEGKGVALHPIQLEAYKAIADKKYGEPIYETNIKWNKKQI